METLLSRLIISDMEKKMDPSQYGNQRGLSKQHYLVKMIHQILTAVDKNSQYEKFAAIANLVDWNNAFPRQCPKLGVEAFLKNGVRPSLIPVLINYFQDRQMSVKWKGCRSDPIRINGGGPQGATLGILEYLAQSNNNADCVEQSKRFKFIDDLTVLEVVNLLTVGISCFNIKNQVPNDIPTHGQFIPSENLKSQVYLNKINEWTKNQQMLINVKKTKSMIFNFTDDYEFTTRLDLEGNPIEVIENTKLLGTIIQNDLKWDMNTSNIIKKANMRMELLRRAAAFGASTNDLKTIYFSYIRSILEHSAVVWHSSLSIENSEDLERIQRSAVKIILQNNNLSYEKALNHLQIDKLSDRREELCLRFAEKCLRNAKTVDMFPEKKKQHQMKTRQPQKFEIQFARTSRLQSSPLIYMQNLLNQN